MIKEKRIKPKNPVAESLINFKHTIFIDKKKEIRNKKIKKKDIENEENFD